MKVEIKQASWDSELVQATLREHLGPEQISTFDQTARLSEIWVGLYNGQAVIIFGLIPDSLLSLNAYVWSFTTPVVRLCRKSFLKHSWSFLEILLKEYPNLVGHCVTKSTWLKHLGAQFVSADTFVIKA